MESTIVIKVKFGDTLRRFNALISKDELDYDMEALRMKILSLFNLASDADLTLTYTDVDGDVVTLVDNEDLRDVIRQCLNPFRIYVTVNNNDNKGVGGGSYSRSSGNSTPMRSPRVEQKYPNVPIGVADVLNSVPEPFREAISKITLDAASKAASSTPQLAELVDLFSKMGQSYLFPGAQSQDGVPSFTQNTNSSKGDDLPAVVPNSTLADASAKNNQNLNANVNNVEAPSNIPNVDDKKETGEGSKGYNSGILGNVDRSGHFPPAHCPFSAMPMADDSYIAPHMHPRMHPFKKFHKYHGGVGGIIHIGVQCDGCGAHPITGPRFKSKVKHDYDLCNICFSRMGNDADYVRYDRPVSFRHSRSKGLYNHVSNPRFCPASPYLFKDGFKLADQRLDSRFILDVNVMDGTMLAPSTPFSKIWRMRNNGSLVWTQGTQLVWIGGDKLSDAVSVEIEVPENGVAIEEEVDVAVDFIAPEKPGRYISYWKMASPSGQKFGQRFWVLIQVDASLKDTVSDGFHDLNLNLPPVNIGSEEPRIADTNVEPMIDCSFANLPNSITLAEPVEPLVEAQPINTHEEKFPINNTLLVGGFSEPVSSAISYPMIDTSIPTAPVLTRAISENNNEDNDNNIVEQTLLNELEQMGFKQVNLNKEILRLNGYNMEQSLDDLCGVAEWDPILKELDEMGFYDRAKNKQLLMKNNGSIKRVVMDLIANEK